MRDKKGMQSANMDYELEITEEKGLLTLAKKGICDYKHHLSTTSETPIHMDKVRWYSTIPNRLHHG